MPSAPSAAAPATGTAAPAPQSPAPSAAAEPAAPSPAAAPPAPQPPAPASPRVLGGGFDEPPPAGSAPAAPAAAPAPATSQAQAEPPATPQQQASASPAAPPPAPHDSGAAPAGDPAGALRFDAIRVSADGLLTMAGRGPAGARIVLLDGDREVGSVEADGSGGWVFVSDGPIAPGDHQFSLRVAGGGAEAASSEVATVVVPKRGQDIAGRASAGADGGTALVIVTPQQGQGASTVLQAPAVAGSLPRPATPAGSRTSASLSINVIDYGDGGTVIVSGYGAAGAGIRLYLNNRPAGEGRTDGNGVFRIQATGDIAPGIYRLRADQLDADGRVTGRAETPFQRAAPADIAVAEGRVVVQPGNSLWRIARRVYGQGPRYTVIYQANQEQIRNPDLIYPGQIFTVPTAQPAAAPG
ncbi:LysM peptidoglycan-binding domain-containing protein [Inquilinus sp.]|uniref:LysM peptidoglycan-binding domain-containing protein n=1 Tax=Inquilinus sp. TaxID=1932117 RepID=UPI0037852985